MMSCNEDEPIPSYIHISNISLTSDQSTEGDSSNNIVDAWVYIDNKEQGVYELPVTFPILAEGATTLNIFGGIKNNGVSSTRVSYPFYSSDTITLNLRETLVDTIKPTVRYNKNASFDFIENFEGGNSFTNITRVEDEVFEGNHSGKMEVEEDSTGVISRVNSKYSIPALSSAVYLEMDYKNNHLFQVGITGFVGGENISVVKLNLIPSDEWKKVYVDFTPEVNGLRADSYEIFFLLIPETEADLIDVYLDNIKLIHFNVIWCFEIRK